MHQMLESPLQRFGIAFGIPSRACAQRDSAAAQAEKPPVEQLPDLPNLGITFWVRLSSGEGSGPFAVSNRDFITHLE
jgi:hypothetical protein